MKQLIKKWLGIKDNDNDLLEMQEAINFLLMNDELFETQDAVNCILMDNKEDND